MKKKKSTRVGDRAKEEKKKNPKLPETPGHEERGSNDYGGLPDRDLKKNLGGCG